MTVSGGAGPNNSSETAGGKRKPVQPSDMPKRCRTWDDKRRVWVPKKRYETKVDATTVAAPARMQAYTCGDHFHVGHSGGKR